MAPISIYVASHGNLEDLLQRLNDHVHEDPHPVVELELTTFPELASQDAKDLLWCILLHPLSKIKKIELIESSADGLVDCGIVKCMTKWCEQIPVRTILLDLNKTSTEKSQEMLEDLREALISPDNRVRQLIVRKAMGDCHRLCEILLRPVLESPNNKLRILDIIEYRSSTRQGMAKGMDPSRPDAECAALSAGLASPNCKVEKFFVSYSNFIGMHCLLEGLCASPRLKRLDWPDLPTFAHSEQHTLFVAHLPGLLNRPGNCLEMLRFPLPHQDVSILTTALSSEHCRLEELDFVFCYFDADVLLPLAMVLRHPNNRLVSLSCNLWGSRTAAAMRESLMDSNCKLESLTLNGHGYLEEDQVVIAVADALRVSPSNRLDVLNVNWEVSSAVFDAMSESLRSPTNKLQELYLHRSRAVDRTTRQSLYRALRISNVWSVSDQTTSRFYNSFNEPSFRVLHTLLSIKYVPRLGKNSCVRVLPLQDFILRIAQTLKWPLHDLSAFYLSH